MQASKMTMMVLAIAGGMFVVAGTSPVAAQCELQKLKADDGAAGDLFGHSVAVSGDTAVIGAFGDDDLGDRSGSAYVFEKVDGVWTQAAKLTASDGAPTDFFG